MESQSIRSSRDGPVSKRLAVLRRSTFSQGNSTQWHGILLRGSMPLVFGGSRVTQSRCCVDPFGSSSIRWGDRLSDWIVNLRLPSDDRAFTASPRPIDKILANQPFPVINGHTGCASVPDGQKIAPPYIGQSHWRYAMDEPKKQPKEIVQSAEPTSSELSEATLEKVVGGTRKESPQGNPQSR